MSTPSIPPRPQRTQAASDATGDVPAVPARPIRKAEISADREASTRSPLNSLPGATSKPPSNHGRSEADVPRRPPSVNLPGIGQEGSEYSSYDQLPSEAQLGAGQTQSVSADLPLHAPVASVPQSTAKRQIETVTRTDSASAAAAGIGRHQPTESPHQPPTGDYGSPLGRTTSNTAGGRRPSSTEPHPLRARASFNRSTASLNPLERTTSRPGSVHGGDHEQGIPEIGRQIPLYPNAGDVQAPSPGPGQSQHAPGIGFFNDGSNRNHTRKRSTRQEFGPPDSYGIRHDHDHQDQFEKAWQAKHPEEAAKEEYHLHIPRPPSALTSEQLNRLVGQTGADISRDATGTPDEEAVLDATEEFINRKSPQKPAGLRPADARAKSEAGDDGGNVVHVYRSNRRASRNSVGSTDNAFDAGHADHGYSSDRDMPILAADEVIKRPNSAFMHAAVDPVDASGDEHYESDHGAQSNSRRNSAQLPSRPSSRPSSMHGAYQSGPLNRYISPEEQLAEIEEYDPLFPEDYDGKSRPKKAQGTRPDAAIMHHFPSQDRWEDTPASLQYSAEVSTPDLVREQDESAGTAPASSTFETPEAEERRKQQNPDSMTSDSKTFIKPRFKNTSREHLLERPGMPRFPSQDTWEDIPDSMRLETTVSGPQEDDSNAASEERSGAPAIPARPERHSKLAQEVTPDALDDETASKTPNVVEKSRPVVPARPIRAGQPGQTSDDAGVSAAKAKPAVPARPSTLRGPGVANAGFLNDLNNRLKLGPQGVPPPRREPEADAAAAEESAKAPLADARKGRVKGPARRKPGPTTELKSASFALSPLITVWSIDEEDELQVESDPVAPAAARTAAADAAAGSDPVEKVAALEKENIDTEATAA